MNKTIRLTESELKRMISESVKGTLNELGWGRKMQPQNNRNDAEMWNRITQARSILISLNKDGLLSKYYEKGEAHDLSDNRSQLKLAICNAVQSLDRAIMLFKDLGYEKGKTWAPELNADVEPYI